MKFALPGNYGKEEAISVKAKERLLHSCFSSSWCYKVYTNKTDRSKTKKRSFRSRMRELHFLLPKEPIELKWEEGFLGN